MDYIILTPLFVTFIAFAYYLFQDARNQRENRLDRQTARYNQLRRYNPDALGNYPAFYDPETNTLIEPSPGNAQFFAAPAPAAAYPAPRAQAISRPLVINYPTRPSLPAEQPEPQLSTDHTPEQLTSGSEPVELELLRQLKGQATPETNAIYSACGIKKGGSKSYLYWRDIYRAL